VACKIIDKYGTSRTNHEHSATLIPAPASIPAPPGPSQDEIRKIVAEYKAKEEKKSKSDAEDKDKEKDKEDKDKEKEKSKPTVPAPAPAPAAAAVAAVHRKFALHRQIFDMRRDDIKRKEQGVKAREVGKGASFSFYVGVCWANAKCVGLPQVPRGMF